MLPTGIWFPNFLIKLEKPAVGSDLHQLMFEHLDCFLDVLGEKLNSIVQEKTWEASCLSVVAVLYYFLHSKEKSELLLLKFSIVGAFLILVNC